MRYLVSKFQRYVKMAKHVLCLDAHLKDNTLQFMTSIDPGSSSLLIINDFVPPKRTAWKVGSYNKAHLAIRRAIMDRKDKPGVFVSACKDQGRAVATDLRAKGLKSWW